MSGTNRRGATVVTIAKGTVRRTQRFMVDLVPTTGGGSLVMPTLKVRDFNFTSLSDAV